MPDDFPESLETPEDEQERMVAMLKAIHSHYSKFELLIPEKGEISLTIRVNDEKELEDLLNTWEPIVRYDLKVEGVVVPIRNGDKPRYFAGDTHECGGKIVTRRGRRGARFLGCSNFPSCLFTQSL